jgi:hypothetical protein
MINMHLGSILPVCTPDEYAASLSSIETRQTVLMLTIVLTDSKRANNLPIRSTEGKRRRPSEEQADEVEPGEPRQ